MVINKMLIKQQEINNMKGKTFYDRYYDKYFSQEGIADCDVNELFDDEVERWHNSDFKYIKMHEYLGLTENEFDTIVLNPSYIDYVLYNKIIGRMENKGVDEEICKDLNDER